MKHEWNIQRKTIQQKQGQHRWDLAYQCLLKWAQSGNQKVSCVQNQEEVLDESGVIHKSIDSETGTEPEH
jgi:uncharacterized protein (UPF0548 family)